ncbi:MAG: pteridine reductase [bacterium]|nr:pteridine reductase [bacterium]
MKPQNKQEAKVALVTGGARRIGSAIVKQLHQAGYKVGIHCRNSLDAASALALELNKKCPDSAVVLATELTTEHAAEQLINQMQQWAGRLDLLVNNASIFIKTKSDSFNNSDWESLFNINLKVPFLLSRAAQPLLAKHQGAIINISDIHAAKPLKGYSVYCQTKAALDMQTKSLAREFAPHIRVNGVAPGAIMWPENANSLSGEEQQHIIAKTPLKCHGHPDYIAQAILALAQNPFITGQIIQVDGGRGLT